MYTLIIEDRNGRSPTETSFDQGSYTIGRVDGNDVVLPSSSVSRTHARIFVMNNKCYIDDLGSANGVTVNDVLIKERTEITNGSKIRIGEYTLYLEYRDDSQNNSAQEVLKTQIVSGDQSGFKLVRVGDKFAGEDFMLSEATNSIGRTEDNYILLSDQSISRNHAKIVNHGTYFVLSDLNSSNGTFLNNKKVIGECTLKPGDLVRFGNVSFVFVPASQVVDFRQYATKRSDNRVFFGIIISIVLIACIGIVVGIIYSSKQKQAEEEAARVAAEQQAELASIEKFNNALNQAEKYYEEKHFEGAKGILESLLDDDKNKSSQKLQDLVRKVSAEIDNEALIKEAEKLVNDKQFQEAIDKFNEVDEDSLNRDLVDERILAVKSEMRIHEYLEASKACDDKLDQSCIENLCAATKKLKGTNDNEQEYIQQTHTLLGNILKKHKRDKLATSANQCLKNLK